MRKMRDIKTEIDYTKKLTLGTLNHVGKVSQGRCIFQDRTNKGTKQIFERRKETKLLRCAIHEPQEFEGFAARNFNMFGGAKCKELM